MKRRIIDFIRRQPRWRLIVAAAAVLCVAFLSLRRGKVAEADLTFAVKRGDLPITVIEGGSVESLDPQEIRSEVKGSQGTKILKIVDEGYLVTEDDVKTGKVLIELDSSDLKDKMVQEEIQYETALSSLTDAAQGYEIQRGQNVSSIKDADQKAQFARMDLEKFLGDIAAGEVIHALKLDKLERAVRQLPAGEEAEQMMLSQMETNQAMVAESTKETNDDDKEKSQKNELLQATLRTRTAPTPEPALDFTAYAKPEKLGDGSAMQDLRKLMDDLQGAQQQDGLAQTKLAGTKRLFAKGFATKTELETDQISSDNSQLKVKTAQTAYDLYIKYEFRRQAQDFALKYEDALRELERQKKEAISKLAQARAKLKGAEGRYNIESAQRKELVEQLDKCTIKASKPGLVVYGGASSDTFYGNQEQIREGAAVRERQPLITIPDMSQMSVRVKVHESYIQKITKGLSAKIQVDAVPDKKLDGEVTKVALLPDSQNRWMNPDLKVYQTTVTIDGSHNWLKPGMSAKVEILVKQLQNVLYVPLQAITEINGKHYCQVSDGKSDRREVTIGEFNDEFIEIKSGLNVGDKVSLRAPEETSEESAASAAAGRKSGQPKPGERKKVNDSKKASEKPKKV